LFITEERAYLPLLGKTPHGLFWECGPLIETSLSAHDLAHAIARLVEAGNPDIPHPTQEEFRKWTPTQKALGTGSWRKLARQGVIACAVSWLESGIAVAFSPPDAKDIQVVDYGRQKVFPRDTDLVGICQYILAEIGARRGARTEAPA
jgi:hypothetical protein